MALMMTLYCSCEKVYSTTGRCCESKLNLFSSGIFRRSGLSAKIETVLAENAGRVRVRGLSMPALVLTYMHWSGVTSTLQVASRSVWKSSE